MFYVNWDTGSAKTVARPGCGSAGRGGPQGPIPPLRACRCRSQRMLPSRCPSRDSPSRSLMRNLRLALRTLLKTPVITGVAVLSLALGIGANAAIFSLFNEMLLQPLAVPHPEELVN